MKDPLEDVQIAETRRGSVAVLLVMLGLFAWLFAAQPETAALIFGIVLIVMLHELGHFLAARRTGMLATEFFFGFGPRIWSIQRGETEYGIKAIPLGGYVKIIGMTSLDKVEPELEARAYRQGRARDRLLVVSAGVLMNVIICFVCLFAFTMGKAPIDARPTTKIFAVVDKSTAQKGGLKVGDTLVAIDGVRLSGWSALKSMIEDRGGKSTVVTIVRGGVQQDVTVKPRSQAGKGFLGVSPTSKIQTLPKPGPVAAAGDTVDYMGQVVKSMGQTFGHLFSPAGITQYSKNFTSAAPAPGTPADLQRPRSLVGIVDQGSRYVTDVWDVLRIVGILSLVLALVNALPLLPLDGGHVAVVAYEAAASKIKGRQIRIDIRKVLPVSAFAFSLLLLLGVSAMVLDIHDVVR